MAALIKGDVVVVPFPFSDLSQAKRRPALILASLPGNDLILCQITSQIYFDSFSIPLTDNDFETGALKTSSFIRPNRIFTADKSIILYKAGHINFQKFESVIDKIIKILR